VAVIPIVILIVHSAWSAAVFTAFHRSFSSWLFTTLPRGPHRYHVEMIQNAELMGASKVRVMLRVRSPYAIAWTLAALPNAIAFGLTATGDGRDPHRRQGLGYQLLLAMLNSNATLLFSIVLVVSVVGVGLVLRSHGHPGVVAAVVGEQPSVLSRSYEAKR